MNEVSVEVWLQKLRADQIYTLQVIHLLFCYEFKFVIDQRTACLLKLLSHVLQVWDPFGCWSKLRNEETANFGILHGS